MLLMNRKIFTSKNTEITEKKTKTFRPDHSKSFLCVLCVLCGKIVFAVLSLFVLASLAMAQDRTVLFRDNFDSLDNWKPFTFPSPKIRKHSVYTIETNGGESFLRAESNDSASAIIYKEAFNAVEYPRARWRWKVSNIYQKGDARAKAGDDYPIRIYVMFEYDPAKASFGESILYGLAKARFGAYPPHSRLTYVWANREEKDRVISSPYTDRVKIVLLRMGPKEAGTWQDEDVDILEDYRKAFGADPPARAHIGIMNDSDNTGESSVSWVDFIEVLK